MKPIEKIRERAKLVPRIDLETVCRLNEDRLKLTEAHVETVNRLEALLARGDFDRGDAKITRGWLKRVKAVLSEVAGGGK